MSEAADPVKLAQIEGVLNLLTERLGHISDRLGTVQDAQRDQNRTLTAVANNQAAMSSHSTEMTRLSDQVSALAGKFELWKDGHEDDNSVVETDLNTLRTNHEASDKSTRRTMQACTGLLAVIVSMFCWFLNDKINYMREADARIERQHETDNAAANHRIDMVEENVRSNTTRLDKMGAPQP